MSSDISTAVAALIQPSHWNNSRFCDRAGRSRATTIVCGRFAPISIAAFLKMNRWGDQADGLEPSEGEHEADENQNLARRRCVRHGRRWRCERSG